MLLDDIATYLEANSIGTVGTDLFKGDMPETPDNCVALFEYAGEPPEVATDIEYPGLQVRVRNTSYSAARVKIDAVYALLHTLANTTLSGTKYLSIFAVQSSPVPLGRDSSNRVDLAQNYKVTKVRN